MTAAIELKGVYKNFGATEIIRGVDWTIEVGELHAMIGPNGGGKKALQAANHGHGNNDAHLAD